VPPVLLSLALLACDGGTTDDTGSAADSGSVIDDTGGGTTDCLETWYVDSDGDGYGGSETTEACEDPGAGWVSNDRDCNDDDGDTWPGASDATCDEIDQDCDDQVDEDAVDAVTLYADNDGDGYGDPDDTVQSCETELHGFSNNADDCNDDETAVNPEAFEICNDGLDNDCSGEAVACRLSGGEVVSGSEALFEGGQSYDYIGSAFSGVGDLDGDGHDDFAIGGRGEPYNWGSSNENGVYVAYGPVDSTMTLADLIHLDGARERRLAGASLADVGDLDGDGFDDLVMGAPSHLWGGDVGAVFFHSGAVVMGESLGDCCAALIGDGGDSGSTGLSIDGGSDFDGDGFPDVAVGVPFYTLDGRNYDGLVHLVSGLPAGDVEAADPSVVRLQAESDRPAGFGFRVADLGDTDGDGIGDLLVSASQDWNNDGRGKAYVFLGPITENRSAEDADGSFEGVYPWQYLGQDIGAAGDLDQDGYRDMFVGGSGCIDTGCDYEGSVLVIHGPVDPNNGFATKAATIRGDEPQGQLGWSLDGDFDSDGDGTPDLVVGVPYGGGGAGGAGGPGGGSYGVGEGLLFYGPFSGSVDASDAGYVVSGDAQYNFAGMQVASLGDLDGDGLDDFGVGAPGFSSSSSRYYTGGLGVFSGSGL
jgi:hypothetical protein